jgi:pantetheine-phosphate adenylyltransferase
MKTIAVFAGSFNPFTIGHLNIVEKAEDIFGKGNVIIAFGVNPDKIDPDKRVDYLRDLSDKCLGLQSRINRPVKIYKGFLHDFVTKLENEGNNVVIVRGLRNGDDLDYEVNQLRFINDFKKGVKTTFIVCDKEYEHISSSAIRKLKEFGGDEMVKQYLV